MNILGLECQKSFGRGVLRSLPTLSPLDGILFQGLVLLAAGISLGLNIQDDSALRCVVVRGSGAYSRARRNPDLHMYIFLRHAVQGSSVPVATRYLLLTRCVELTAIATGGVTSCTLARGAAPCFRVY